MRLNFILIQLIWNRNSNSDFFMWFSLKVFLIKFQHSLNKSWWFEFMTLLVSFHIFYLTNCHLLIDVFTERLKFCCHLRNWYSSLKTLKLVLFHVSTVSRNPNYFLIFTFKRTKVAQSVHTIDQKKKKKRKHTHTQKQNKFKNICKKQTFKMRLETNMTKNISVDLLFDRWTGSSEQEPFYSFLF